MKNIYKYFAIACITFGIMTSCDDWFDVETRSIQSEEEVFSSKDGIVSVLSNIYDRLPDFSRFDVGAMCDWDEAVSDALNQGSSYDNGYKRYWDYGLIRDINLFLENIEKYSKDLPKEDYDYFIGEGRFLRAYVYFYMVQNMGGVPLILQSYQWDENKQPLDYSFPRETESRIYNFICDEVDSIKEDLNVAADEKGTLVTKTRATKGAALALKSRAALYAGCIAKYTAQRPQLEITTPGWEAGIPAAEAKDFFQKSLDAAQELITELPDTYALYDLKMDKADNYYEALTEKGSANKELIFIRDFDGKNMLNYFTDNNIPRSLRSGAGGSKINPTLNLVEKYETVTEGPKPIRTNKNKEVIENPVTDWTSEQDYIVYDHVTDILAGRDPRLFGTILTPGSSFRGKELQMWAGLAVKKGDHSWEFKSVNEIFDLDDLSKPDKIYYDGRQMTGIDGPHVSPTITNSQEVGSTGFLIRKFVDSKAGSEMMGQSDIAYVRFRYAEVLLNAAESAYELGDKNSAAGYLNQIRARAGLPDLKEIASIEQIRNERSVELAFEGHRFYDVKRWRTGDQLFDGNNNNPTAVMYGLWPYKIYAPGDPDDNKWIFRRVKAVRREYPLFFQPHNYYAGIDQEVLNANPLLVKNPHQR